MRIVGICLSIFITIEFCVTNPLLRSKKDKQREDAVIFDIHVDDSDQISKHLADSWDIGDTPAKGDKNKDSYFMWPQETTFIDNNVNGVYLVPKQGTWTKVATPTENYLTTISPSNPKLYIKDHKDQISKKAIQLKNADKYNLNAFPIQDITSKKAKTRKPVKNGDQILTSKQVETTTNKVDKTENMVSNEGKTTTDSINEYTGTIEILDPFIFTIDMLNKEDVDGNADGVRLTVTPGVYVDQHAAYTIEEMKHALKSSSDKSSPSLLFILLTTLVILLLIIALVVALLIWCGLEKKRAIPKADSKEWCRIATLEKIYMYPIKSCGPLKTNKANCNKFGLQCGYIKDRHLMVVDENRDAVTLNTSPIMITVVITGVNSVLILRQPNLGRIEIDLNEIQKSEPMKVNINKVKVPAMDCGAEPMEWFTKLLSPYHSSKKFNLVQCLTDKPYKNVYSSKHDVWAFSDGPMYYLINKASVDELNERLNENDKVTVFNFRPNFVIEGAEPYDEDNWKYVKIGPNVFEILEPYSLNETVTINPNTGTTNPRLEPLRTLRMYRQFEKSGDNKTACLGILMALRSKSQTLIKVNDIVFVVYKKGIQNNLADTSNKNSVLNNKKQILIKSTTQNVYNVSSCSAVFDNMDLIVKQIVTYESLTNPTIKDESNHYSEKRKGMSEEGSFKINAVSTLNSLKEKQQSHFTTDGEIDRTLDNEILDVIESFTVASRGKSREKSKSMIDNEENIIIKDVLSNQKAMDEKSYLISYSAVNSKIFRGTACMSDHCSHEDLHGTENLTKRTRELFFNVVSFDKLSKARSCLNFNELKKVLHYEELGDFKVLSSHTNCISKERLSNLTVASKVSNLFAASTCKSSYSVKDFSDLKIMSSLDNNVHSKNEAPRKIDNCCCKGKEVGKEKENDSSKPGTSDVTEKLPIEKLDKITYAIDETHAQSFLKCSDKNDKSVSYPEKCFQITNLPEETFDTTSYTIDTVTPKLLSWCENEELRMATEDKKHNSLGKLSETKKMCGKTRDISTSNPQKPHEIKSPKKYERYKDELDPQKPSVTKNLSTEFEKIIYARKITASRLQVLYEEKDQMNEYEVDVDVTNPRKYSRTKDLTEEKVNKAICTKGKVSSCTQTYLF